MSVTLDGSTLTVEKWSEDTQAQGSQWDGWSGSSYHRKVKNYGVVRTYQITFLEQNVSWTNSLVNKYLTDCVNGNTVAFVSTLSVRPVSSVNVYILEVQFDMENLGGQNVRAVTVTIQEA